PFENLSQAHPNFSWDIDTGPEKFLAISGLLLGQLPGAIVVPQKALVEPERRANGRPAAQFEHDFAVAAINDKAQQLAGHLRIIAIDLAEMADQTVDESSVQLLRILEVLCGEEGRGHGFTGLCGKLQKIGTFPLMIVTME